MRARVLTLLSFLASVVLHSIASPGFSIDEDLMNLMVRSMELYTDVHTHDPARFPEGSSFHIDGPNAAMSYQEDNYCFIVFDSTQPNAADWWQNIDPTTGQICPRSGPCCLARNGFRRSYEDPSYRSVLENELDTCLANCPECQAVLVGHSQGSGTAAVAGVALADTNPIIIAFGAPASVLAPCPLLNPDRYHRFCNTIVENGDLDYDPLVAINWNADQFGHLYVMGDDVHNVAYYGNGKGPNMVQYGFQFRAHGGTLYLNRVHAFRDNFNGEIGTNGWSEGFACNIDNECIDSCVAGKCHRGINGDSCNTNSDCDSGRCEGFISWINPGICEPKLGNGSPCNAEDSDCLSNQCWNTFWKPWDFRCRP